MMFVRAFLLAVATVFAIGGAASAPLNPPTQVTTDLNLRSGPGTQYQAQLVIPAGSGVQLLGCAGDWSWCNVQYRNVAGWVATRYLHPQPAGATAKPAPSGPQLTIELPFPFGNGDDDRINVVGTLTNQGAECRTMRGDNGQTYSLVGDLGAFRPGDRVRVRGAIAGMSFCMQGTTIEVRSIRAAN